MSRMSYGIPCLGEHNDYMLDENYMTHKKDYFGAAIPEAKYEANEMDDEEYLENLLKGLYFWDPEQHKNMTQLKEVIENPMTKDLIISNVKSNIKYDDSKSKDWARVVENIRKGE